ncbi:oxidized low-density lipoprotein receptor 1 [Oryzias melastigma]|uniref:Oxidized low-density lipoprotein receptor 1-like n=1 Tax=Oryzias melastigma TaxID=30732 RepID=A0A3B3C0B3_ORYME|nr:oxidized low-density lipoprotein receptor 1 [Oryzias melastigma]
MFHFLQQITSVNVRVLTQLQHLFCCISLNKMSSGIYAKPDFSKKVRYNRNQQEDSSDWEECEVTIYNEAYESVENTTRDQSPEQAPQTEAIPKVQKRSRCDKWCLLALCTVLSTVIIILSSSYMVVSISNLQKNVEKQNNKFEDMAVNINNLEKDLKEQLEDMAVNMSNLLKNLKDQNNKFDVINKTLLDETKVLKNKSEGKQYPELWMKFGSSCYYKSTEERTWPDSRSFCQFVGADLLVINSKEEQEFVSKMNPNKESWIGLYVEWSLQKSEWKWEWLDGSPLTETFWDETFPKDPKNYYDFPVLSTEGKWKVQNYSTNKNWICEK